MKKAQSQIDLGDKFIADLARNKQDKGFVHAQLTTKGPMIMGVRLAGAIVFIRRDGRVATRETFRDYNFANTYEFTRTARRKNVETLDVHLNRWNVRRTRERMAIETFIRKTEEGLYHYRF